MYNLPIIMSTINRESVFKLEENQNIEVYTNGVNILLKLLDNVIREPHNLKYRKIRLENQTVKDKVLCLSGVRELLQHIGFEEVGTKVMNKSWFIISGNKINFSCYFNKANGELNLSMSVLIARVKDYRDLLRERLNAATDRCAIPVASTSGAKPKITVKTAALAKSSRNPFANIRPFHERITFPKVIV